MQKDLKLVDKYIQAVEAEKNQQYDTAKELFEELGEFRDSNERIKGLRRPIKVVNDYTGLMRTAICLTVTGIYTKHPIPIGTTVLEIPPGEYECTLYCVSKKEPYLAIQKQKEILRIPSHSKIDISWKLSENGYYMNLS